MPVYEFDCGSCGKRFTTLVGMVAGADEAVCPFCGSNDARRRISRFRIGRDEDARMEEMADRLEQMGEPESPSEMREVMKEMGRALDEDASEEMEEIFEQEVAPELDDTP